MSDDQFPVLFNNSQIHVFLNPSKEVFIRHQATGAEIRLNAGHNGLTFSSSGCHVDPMAIGVGEIEWMVKSARIYKQPYHKRMNMLPRKISSLEIRMEEDVIIITDLLSTATMKIRACQESLAFSSGGHVRPTTLNGFIAWGIIPS